MFKQDKLKTIYILAAQVSYSYVGNSITISNFKAIGANQLIGITFKANNPAASGIFSYVIFLIFF